MRQYRAFLKEIPKLMRRGKKNLKAPLLVVWGEKDPYVEGVSSHDFQGFASDVTFRFLKRGHWHFREEPDETNRVLNSFFEGTFHAGSF